MVAKPEKQSRGSAYFTPYLGGFFCLILYMEGWGPGIAELFCHLRKDEIFTKEKLNSLLLNLIPVTLELLNSEFQNSFHNPKSLKE
jgi:hypothetical protein